MTWTNATLLQGVENARFMVFASLTVVVVDYALTLQQEITYFWSQRWSIFRMLFHINRTCVPLILLLNLLCLFMRDVSPDSSCIGMFRATFILDVVAVIFIQVVVVLRVCFSEGIFSRILVGLTFVGNVAATIPLAKIIVHELGDIPQDVSADENGLVKQLGCDIDPPMDMWKMFIPNTVLQSVLFLVVVMSATRVWYRGGASVIMARILREETIFFVVAFGSSLFSVIGALSPDWTVAIPAMYSGFWLGASSVAVSRLMLSMRSLAPSISADPDLLLSKSELSRVRWTQGSRKGELLVEVNSIEEAIYDADDVSEEDMQHPSERPQTPAIHVTRVGMYDNPVLSGA